MSISSPHLSSQSGVVSIFVVIFFMIFVSVIAVGFVKVANDDLSQSIDSDLSASALASAQSGAEDGKRLLIFCRTKTAGNPTLQAECDNVLGSTDCRAFLNSSTLLTALKVDKDPATGDGRVSANSAYEQRYTCMTVKTLTDSVEGISVKKETSELIPLVAETGKNFTNVNFSWHETADARDGAVNVFRTNTSLPADDQWKSGTSSYPAAMRLEFIAYPKSGIDLNKLDEDTRTVFLIPGSGVASTTTVNLTTADVRDTDPAPGRQYNPNAASEKLPVLVRCQSGTEYACSVNIQVAGALPSVSYNYFLRVSSLYSSAYIKAEMYNGPIAPANRVRFDNVQPVIDVTGRTNDVFRRVQTRVQFDANMYLPQYALEASEICKDMVVADTGANSTDNCYP